MRSEGEAIALGFLVSARPDSVTIARGRIGVSYHATTGMVSSLSSADTVTLDYGFDGALLTSETWSGKLPGNVTLGVGHTYTPAFTESTVTVAATSPILFSHDLDGLVTAAGALSIHHRSDNGLTDSTKASSVTNSTDYDDAGALANISYRLNNSSTPFFLQSILRDALGRVVQITENAFGTSRTLYYRYDQAGRLYGVKLNADTLATYFYDPNGNRIAVKTAAGTDSATYDEQDRLISRGVMATGYTRYTYTAAGELKSKTVESAVTQYVYDPLGNLVSVTLPNGDVVKYSADGTGRRVGRRLNGSWTGGWVYRNGLNVVADLDGTGAVVNRYVYGLDDQVPALLLRGASTYRLITDQLGSVRGVVDVSSGQVMQQTDYDAWGVPTVVSGGTFQALGYAGGLTDATTGLVRFGARDYDPAAGRWTAKDPVIFRGGPNEFAYANDLPTTLVDPLGLCTLQLGLSVSYVFQFGVAGTLEAGVVIDDKGRVGIFKMIGGGKGWGAGAAGGVLVAVSNGATIWDIQGPFTATGATLADGIAVSAGAFTGRGNGPGGMVSGAGAVVGVGEGGGGYLQGTATDVYPVFVPQEPGTMRGRGR